jgi:hypothetical protein
MNRKYSKNEFINLDFDDKCLIIETLLTDDYYQGQTDIGFWVPENFDPESKEDLPPTPPEIEKIEDEKFEALIINLTDKLFLEKDFIEFDLEQTDEE